MPVFISYSHADSDFAGKLAAHLVKQNAHVWIDKWELNVGDSIVLKIQEAIQESSALLVLLSNSSTNSEWCKKELSAGLMRELEEKRVVVLPVLLENCDIPLFLRDKMYADFRESFESGLKDLSSAVARVTSLDQGRIETGTSEVDWAEDWGYDDGKFVINYTIIETSKKWPFTLLTQIHLRCNDVVTKRYKQYESAGLGWLGRIILSEALADLANADDFRFLLEDQFPRQFGATLQDQKLGASYEIFVQSRRLGEDTGKDQLVNITNYLHHVRNYVKSVARKPTESEKEEFRRIITAPW